MQFNDGGVLGGTSWSYDPGTGAITATTDDVQNVENIAGTGPICVWSHGPINSQEFLSINGDAAGTLSTTADQLFINSQYFTQFLLVGAVGINVPVMTMFAGNVNSPFGPVLEGMNVFPNLSVGTLFNHTDAFGNATGIILLSRALVEPTAFPREGDLFWVDPSNDQLLLRTSLLFNFDQISMTPLLKAFTFAADADQVLTEAESRATQVRINPGTISAPRTIRSLRIPSLRRSVVVRNLNAFDVDWGWSSGAVVTVPAGKSAIIGGTGANAELLLVGSAT